MLILEGFFYRGGLQELEENQALRSNVNMSGFNTCMVVLIVVEVAHILMQI